MSDIITTSKMADGTVYKTRWHDNGDGTYSRVDYLSGGTIDAVTEIATVNTVNTVASVTNIAGGDIDANLQTAGADVSVTNPLFSAAKFVDENGVAYGVKHIENKPRVSAMPYEYDIAEGNVSGHTSWGVTGYSPTVNTTESDIWSKAGVYVFPTAEGMWEVVSSDNTQDIGTVIFTGTSTGGSTTTLIDTAADFTAGTAAVAGDCVILDKSGASPEYGWVTAVTATTLTISGGFSAGGSGSGRTYHVIDYSAKSGAHAVKIEYLDDDFVSRKEIAILNGTTAVDTVNTNYYRVNAFSVIAAGSGAKPVGNITLRADGAGTTYDYITAGFTRARSTIYTVPTAKVLYITYVSMAYATTGNANKEYARMYARATQEGNTFRLKNGLFQPRIELVAQNATVVAPQTMPGKILSGVDLKVSAIATATGASVCTLRGWLETA